MVSLSYILNFIFQTLISSSVLLILIQIVRCVVIPKLILKSYNKQDVQARFFLFLGAVTRERAYEKTHKDILGYYKQLAKDTPDLSALIYNFGSRIDVSLLSPKLIKEFYQNESLYQKGFTTKAIKTLTGTGLFVAEGDLWKSHRKIISSMFHYDFLKKNVPVIISTARELFHKISKGSLQQVNIADEIQRITGEVVGKIFFSEKLNDYQFKGQPLTLYLTEMLTRLPTIFRDPKIWFLVITGLDLSLASSYRKFAKDMKEFRHFCLKIIQKHRAINSKDLIGNLLETQSKKAQNPHEIFSDEDITSEFLTFFIAGMDTTGQLVTMALLLLHLNPKYIQDIEKEITDIYEREDLPSLETINKMKAVHGVVKETLRLYGSAPKIPAREALVDHKLGDLEIRKGMFVKPVPIYNHMNRKYFEEPEKFKPERWLGNKDVDPFVYIPFSAGSRNCIGQHLAIIEAKVIVIEFFRMFRSKLVPENYDLVMTFISLYKPKNPVILDLELRN